MVNPEIENHAQSKIDVMLAKLENCGSVYPVGSIPLPELWKAYGMDTRNNRPAGVYIGILSGPKELCMEWLEATTPGWIEDVETGRATLRRMTVWHITPEKIVKDRAAYKARINKGQA